jgi:D-alanine-D-alanine ligase
MVDRKRKLRVGLIFGGRSGEHEISLLSARSVAAAIDRDLFDVTLVGIDTSGRWHLLDEVDFERLTGGTLPSLRGAGEEILLPAAPVSGGLVRAATPGAAVASVDVVFPILHGTFGEDGCIQGLFELADVAYVGAGVLGSAVGMDKITQKRLLAAAGIRVAPFLGTSRAENDHHPQLIADWAAEIGFPVFVKPANMGSSVGVSKVTTPAELPAAVEEALVYDNRILVEKGLDAREIECAVLGNDDPLASVPGEIRPNAEYYSYAAKYIDEKGAELLIPAPISEAQSRDVRELSIQVFRALDCSGLARVDFLLERDTGLIYLNELNSLPGFTTISMYPKLWEASGISYQQLITRLLDLAVEKHAQKRRLKTSYAAISEARTKRN